MLTYKEITKGISLTKFPFRGIFSEISNERGISRQAIQQAAKSDNQEILEILQRKIEERKHPETAQATIRRMHESDVEPDKVVLTLELKNDCGLVTFTQVNSKTGNYYASAPSKITKAVCEKLMRDIGPAKKHWVKKYGIS